MTPEAFRALALALPDAFEAPHFDRTSFRVVKKIFATMAADGREVMVRVPQRERLDALLEDPSGTFFDYGGYTNRNHALGVRLAQVEPALLRDLLIDSWTHAAPKKSLAALEAAMRERPELQP